MHIIYTKVLLINKNLKHFSFRRYLLHAIITYVNDNLGWESYIAVKIFRFQTHARASVTVYASNVKIIIF